jgi:hypothetical protein
MSRRDLYPVAVVEDRYGGAYSKGKWLAIAESNKLENGAYRIVRCLEDGPHGDDTEAAMFWSDPPGWIASGSTPDEAIKNLREQSVS